MVATLRLEGMQDLDRALKQLGDRATKHVADAVNATGLELRTEIVKKYQRGPATGAIYRRGNTVHQASAAGEAPATDTGRLASSVQYSKTGPIEAEVKTEVKYGPMLEFGTINIQPRPNWVPSVEAIKPKFNGRLQDALRKAANERR